MHKQLLILFLASLPCIITASEKCTKDALTAPPSALQYQKQKTREHPEGRFVPMSLQVINLNDGYQIAVPREQYQYFTVFMDAMRRAMQDQRIFNVMEEVVFNNNKQETDKQPRNSERTKSLAHNQTLKHLLALEFFKLVPNETDPIPEHIIDCLYAGLGAPVPKDKIEKHPSVSPFSGRRFHKYRNGRQLRFSKNPRVIAGEITDDEGEEDRAQEGRSDAPPSYQKVVSASAFQKQNSRKDEGEIYVPMNMHCIDLHDGYQIIVSQDEYPFVRDFKAKIRRALQDQRIFNIVEKAVFRADQPVISSTQIEDRYYSATMIALAKNTELKALLAEEFFQLVPEGHVDDIPEHILDCLWLGCRWNHKAAKRTPFSPFSGRPINAGDPQNPRMYVIAGETTDGEGEVAPQALPAAQPAAYKDGK